jgi:hypothetical protein
LSLGSASNEKDKHFLAVSYPFSDYLELMKNLKDYGVFPANARNDIEYYVIDKSNAFLPVQVGGKFPAEMAPKEGESEAEDPTESQLRLAHLNTWVISLMRKFSELNLLAKVLQLLFFN